MTPIDGLDGSDATSTASPLARGTGSLDERYGRTPGRRRRDRWLGLTVAVAFTLVFGLWVVWVGLGSPDASLDAVDTGHRVLDDHMVRVNYSVTMPPGSTASCALQAQNAEHAIVGWKIVTVPESTGWTQSFSEEVLTTEEAVTGLIYRCWVT